MEREFKAAQLRRQDAIQRDLVLAWHVEAFARTKRLPSLETLLTQVSGGTKKQTPQEMKERIKELVGEFKVKRRVKA